MKEINELVLPDECLLAVDRFEVIEHGAGLGDEVGIGRLDGDGALAGGEDGRHE